MILDEEKARVIAFEIGLAVLQLLQKEESITQSNISELLEDKRRRVENVIHKFILKGTAEIVRNGFGN